MRTTRMERCAATGCRRAAKRGRRSSRTGRFADELHLSPPPLVHLRPPQTGSLQFPSLQLPPPLIPCSSSSSLAQITVTKYNFSGDVSTGNAAKQIIDSLLASVEISFHSLRSVEPAIVAAARTDPVSESSSTPVSARSTTTSRTPSIRRTSSYKLVQ